MSESISTSIKIAKHIAYLCDEFNRKDTTDYEYNATKIQKLLYICYGVVLACTGKRLTDESPVIWPYGPVFPKALNDFKKNNFKSKYAEEDDGLDESIKEILSVSVGFFGKFKAGQLSTWSHSEGSPWDIVASIENSGWNQKIPDGILKSYFEKEVVKRYDD